MTLALIIALILVGFIMLLLEILVIPGFIVGIIGIISIGAGIAMVYSNYGSLAGNYSAGAAALLVLAGFFVAFKFNTWKIISLEDQLEGKANISSSEGYSLGSKGETISALRPTGNAIIDGKKVEVASLGEAIESNRTIEIIKLAHNKIFVKEIDT